MSGRYCEKTQSVLYGLYRKSRDVEIPTGSCLGCGSLGVKWKEARGAEYCQKGCQEIYHTLLKPLGGKRLLEVDRGKGEKAVDFPQFLKLLEMVDESMAPTIIHFAYPNYTHDITEMRAVLDLRTQSKQLKELIERYLLRPVESLSSGVTRDMSSNEILLFPNLKKLKLIWSAVDDIGTLIHLEELVIESGDWDTVGDDSIENLVNLKSLTLTRTQNINSSLSRLTNLQTLVLNRVYNVTDTTITRLSTTLRQLTLVKVRGIHDLSLSTLTNIEDLVIKRSNDITDSGILPLRKLAFLRLVDCEWIESHGLSRMNQLTNLVVKDCPRFTGTGFVLGVPLEVLIIKRLPNINETRSGFVRQLIYLKISDCNISDKSIQYATNLRTLRIYESTTITDNTISRLTNLEKLSLGHHTPHITRGSIRNLVKLRKLQFFLSGIESDTIPLRLENLRKLTINDSDAISNQDLPYLTSLTQLNIFNNKMIDGSTFIYLPILRMLQLEGKSIVNGGFVAALANLEVISLENNKSFEGKYLRNLPKLKTIYLYDGTSSNDWRDVDRVRDEAESSEEDDEESEIF